MKNKNEKTSYLRRKLGSRRGSSVLYALLILLVCVVIASIVLAAGTVAAGRIAKVAKNDRRYYAVVSAAEMFKDQLDGQTVEIVWKRSSTEDREYVITIDEENKTTINDHLLEGSRSPIYQLVQKDGDTYVRELDFNEREINQISDLLINATLDVILGTERTAEMDSDEKAGFLETVWSGSGRQFVAANATKNFSIALFDDVEGTVEAEESMKVNLEYKLGVDGTITLTVSSAISNDDVYSIVMVYKPVIDDEVVVGIPFDNDEGKATSSIVDGNDVVVQRYSRTTETERRVSYKWMLASVDTVATKDESGQTEILTQAKSKPEENEPAGGES